MTNPTEGPTPEAEERARAAAFRAHQASQSRTSTLAFTFFGLLMSSLLVYIAAGAVIMLFAPDADQGWRVAAVIVWLIAAHLRHASRLMQQRDNGYF